jgi:hypothetical protein
MYSWFNLIWKFQAAKLGPLFNLKRKEKIFFKWFNPQKAFI